ncbi:MAG: tetratricopeptide repeat protein [Nitrososphaeraceae archaeon]
MDQSKPEDLGSNEVRSKFLSKCTDVINLISTGYRILTNDYFPRNYSLQDVMAYTISYSSDGKHFHGESICTSPDLTFVNTYPDDSPQVDLNDVISDYIVRMPLHTELIMNSEDFLRDKNYRIAIIEADTAVESLIYKILMNHYKQDQNIPDGEFKTAFIKQLEKNRIDDNKQWLRLISSQIVDGDEWKTWKSECHDIRNDVIHHNKKASKIEAENALSAAKVFIEILKQHLYDENDWLNEGKAFSSDKERAIQYLKNSIGKKESSEAYFHLGNIYLQHRNYDLAIHYYEEALKLVESPDCYFNLGRAYEEQKIYNQAIINFDKSIELQFEVTHPTANPYYRKFIIMTREGLKDYDLDAIIDLLRVLYDIFPNYEEFSHNLVVTYDMKKDHRSALPYINKLVELSPENPNHYFKRSIYEIISGEKEKALDDIEKTLSLDKRFKELITKEHLFDVLKNDERYKSIMNKRY